MAIREDIEKTRKEITELSAQISDKWKLIDRLYASCPHSWTEPRFQVKKINYDVGSYGGSYDHREWERECRLCGKVETTQKENIVSVPDFETNNAKITVPHFDWQLAQQHSPK